MAAAVQFSSEHETGSHAGADGQEDEVVDAARGSAPAFADRCEVDVVLEHDRQVEPLAQLLGEAHALEAGDVLGEADDAVRAPRRPRARRR